ncbi:hypothetical protein GCM10008090_29260 [Arenicella chitinivorans]|uniref:Uncharacterized protein n=1 Tax=Arenicella chitinivorans TaxID=1329800 RepID=A0A918VRU8_9GAMM|nr:hypothetical protein GCM10008090_29260 [Arenicella chitinivorans]
MVVSLDVIAYNTFMSFSLQNVNVLLYIANQLEMNRAQSAVQTTNIYLDPTVLDN